ncbi:MAG: hypothetical protein ACOC5S_05635 [Acidobacteriota bacterium]
MKVWESYFQGIKDALKPKMVAILWLINFLFASVLYFLISGLLSDAISWSPKAEALMKKGDFNVVLDILVHRGGEVSMILSVAFILFFFYYLASLFLRGGVLYFLSLSLNSKQGEKEERFASLFFRGAGRFFGRFFRLMIYSLVLWIGFALINVLIHLFAGVLSNQGDNEKMLVVMIWVRLVIFLFFYFFVLMVLDYARIRIVLENSRKVLKNMFWSLGFVLTKLGRTLALYYILVVTGILIAIVYWLFDSLIPGQTLMMVMLAFVLGQVFILARSWLTVAFQAAQMRFLTADSKKKE